MRQVKGEHVGRVIGKHVQGSIEQTERRETSPCIATNDVAQLRTGADGVTPSHEEKSR